MTYPGFLRRWGALIAFVVLAGVLVSADYMLKQSPLPGYHPPEADWRVAAEDFGQFWGALEGTEAYAVLEQEVSRPLIRFERAVYRETGVRPSPLRWKAWMGHRFLASGGPEGAGISVRPGIALRAVHAFRVWVLGEQATEGVYTFGDMAYAWRNGFLILSPGPGYVRACLNAPVLNIPRSERQNELRVERLETPPAMLRIVAEEGLPISGWLEAGVTPRETPLTLPEAWPQPAILTAHASKWADLTRLFDGLAQPYSESPTWQWGANMYAHIGAAWDLPALPSGWDAEVDETALSVALPQPEAVLPVPSWQLVLRGEDPDQDAHPLEPLMEALDPIAYEWAGQPGQCAPILGEQIQLCTSQHGSGWLATGNEPAMARLAGNLGEGTPVDADAYLQLNWHEAAEAIEKWLVHAAEEQLLPGAGVDDVRHNWLNWVRALRNMGQTRLTGHAEKGRLQYEGHLVEGAVRPEDPSR